MEKQVLIFEKEYDGESIVDLDRDISEAFDARYNPPAAIVPIDEHGFQQGTFIVKIEWIPPNES